MAKTGKLFLREFIELYKNEVALWQVKNEKYRNKHERNKSLKILLRKLKQYERDATIETVKRKINSLRTCYMRELQRVRRSQSAGDDEIYVPAIWYFGLLDFLGDQVVEEGGGSTMNDTLEIKKETRVVTKPVVTEEVILEIAAEHLGKAISQPKRDEAVVFSEGWAILYRKLDDEQKIYAKRVIDDVFMHGQLNQLKFSTNLSLFDEIIDEIKDE